MSIYPYFNTAIGSCFIIILVMIDYLRKYNTDIFQRKLLMIVLGAIFVTAIFDFTGIVLNNRGENHINTLLYFIWTIYYITRTFVFYYGVVFIDHFAHGDEARTKKLMIIINMFIVINIISVVLNIPFGYYFYISPDNSFVQGPLYLLQIFMICIPLLIIIIDIFLAPLNVKKIQIVMTFIFLLIIALGALLDLFLGTTNLIWPCITSAALYIYFFIIRSDAKIDSLTGVGNRNSFNEYADFLSKQNVKKSYTFILFDLDRFKEINDTLGHLEGDNALRDMATILKGCIRHTDFAARYGGDEFILVIPAENDINRIIERVKNGVRTQNRLRLRPYQIYISYGYGVYTTNSGVTIEEFLAGVDRKMYQYKEARRGKLPSAITVKLGKEPLPDGDNDV